MHGSTGPARVHLDDLQTGVTGLAPGAAHNAAEAAAVCFHDRGHSGDLTVSVSGCVRMVITLSWTTPTQQAIDSHSDFQDAVKDGAVGMAALCAPVLFNRKIIKQSYKGTGFDYYLNDQAALLFQDSIGYEISGIMNGDDRSVENRMRQKRDQVRRGSPGKDAKVFVMEFSKPQARTATV